MESKNFMTVDEVAQELNVSKSYAYKVVRELNAEMQKLGYLTVTGRVNTSFFRKKLFPPKYQQSNLLCYFLPEAINLFIHRYFLC